MTRDGFVFWAVLVVTVGAWVAAGFGFLGGGFGPIVIAIVVTLIAALVGALNLDRRGARRLGGHYNRNTATFYAPMGNDTWQVPTPYIDHPSGGGSPPGIDDAPSLEDIEGDREGRYLRPSVDGAADMAAEEAR